MLLRFGILLTLLMPSALAHVGVNEVYFEGLAGPYPLNVVIRPPNVIPGIATVEVRALAKDLESLKLTPMALTGAGSKFPPTPEAALRSSVDPQFWTGSVWIMAPGSWQIRLLVHGARGDAALSIPLIAASSKVAQMDSGVAWVLIALISLLVIGAAGIAGAATVEAQLPAGVAPLSQRKLWITRGLSVGLAALVLALGWQWWESESRAYAATLYKPLAMQLRQNGASLTVKLRHTGWLQNKSLDNFLEEHGHRMHLFLVRDEQPSALLHLHPIATRPAEFDFRLPPLRPGTYRAFADIVHSSGFAETVTEKVVLASVPTELSPPPPDDAGIDFALHPPAPNEFLLPNNYRVRYLQNSKLISGKPMNLRFEVVDQDGNLAKNLKPYLGMAGHLIIFSQDYSVFAHLHPSGTPSMSAFEMGNSTLSIGSAVDDPIHGAKEITGAELSFPFGFPQPGNYRVVLQFRDSKQIYSAAFDFSVQ